MTANEFLRAAQIALHFAPNSQESKDELGDAAAGAGFSWQLPRVFDSFVWNSKRKKEQDKRLRRGERHRLSRHDLTERALNHRMRLRFETRDLSIVSMLKEWRSLRPWLDIPTTAPPARSKQGAPKPTNPRQPPKTSAHKRDCEPCLG